MRSKVRYVAVLYNRAPELEEPRYELVIRETNPRDLVADADAVEVIAESDFNRFMSKLKIYATSAVKSAEVELPDDERQEVVALLRSAGVIKII